MISQEKLIRVRAPKPRELPQCGFGSLHDEQQYCYEMGYREGIAALRKAQRKALTESYAITNFP